MEELAKEIDKVSNRLTDLRWEIWTEYTRFSWQWWMLLSASVLFAVLFVLLIPKQERLSSLAFYGVIYVLNKNLDDAATALDWYDYRFQLEPIIPTLLPANLFVIPMGFSILYIRFKTWKHYLMATAASAGFLAYIILPLMKEFRMYEQKVWTPHWSFFSLLLMTSLAKLIVDRITARAEPSSSPV